jgi:hypothetical protein
MLFHKIEKEYWPTLITFLVYLNRMPEELDVGVKLSEVVLDKNIVDVLRKI